MDWVDLAQDRDKCQAVVKAVMNIQGCIKYGRFLG